MHKIAVVRAGARVVGDSLDVRVAGLLRAIGGAASGACVQIRLTGSWRADRGEGPIDLTVGLAVGAAITGACLGRLLRDDRACGGE